MSQTKSLPCREDNPISQNKRQWCAVLAKLVAPMAPETAVRAFVDMLPMLPPDDTLYNRQTLEDVATCTRRTAVPTYADLSAVLRKAAYDRLPATVRMGYVPPKWRTLPPPAPPSQEEIEYVSVLVANLTAELRARGQGNAPPRG